MSRSKRARRIHRQQRDRNFIRAAAEPSRMNLACTVEITAAKDGEANKRPTFKVTAYTGTVMNLMGFYSPVIIDLSGLKAARSKIPALLDHDPSRIVGQGEPKIDAKGVEITGIVTGDDADAQKVVAHAKNGFEWQASVGASIVRREFLEAGKKATVNGREVHGPAIIARESLLQEFSFVAIGADGQTSASVAASLSMGDQDMNFEQWLKAKGFDSATLTDESRKFLKAQYDAEIKAAATPPAGNAKPGEGPPAGGTGTPITATGVVDGITAAAAAEELRISSIRAACQAYPGVNFTLEDKSEVPLVAHAIAQKWTKDQTELYALRASRSQAPAAHIKSHDADCTLQAMQGAMMIRAGVALDHKAFSGPEALHMNLPSWLRAGLNSDARQKVMEAAHRYRSMSMVDVCKEALRIEGKDAPVDREETIHAAFSTNSLVNIYTTNVNTKLLATFMEAGDTTLGWTRTTDVADFKTNERPRLTKGSNLEKLPRGQEAKHATRSDKVESYKIARYAKQFVVDEQDVIDDAFNALQDMPVEFGNGAARLRPDLVYAILLSNPTMTQTGRALFHTTDGNLGSGSPLNSANLKAAIAAMKLLQENGVNLNTTPTHLLVPPTLMWLALELIKSAGIVIAGTAGSVTERGTKNVLEGIVSVVDDPRLENGLIDPDSETLLSGSASDWFLAANGMPTVEVAYLRGKGRVPSVRSFTLDKGSWGIGWDINLDIGAKAMAVQGLRKTTA